MNLLIKSLVATSAMFVTCLWCVGLVTGLQYISDRVYGRKGQILCCTFLFLWVWAFMFAITVAIHWRHS